MSTVISSASEDIPSTTAPSASPSSSSLMDAFPPVIHYASELLSATLPSPPTDLQSLQVVVGRVLQTSSDHMLLTGKHLQRAASDWWNRRHDERVRHEKRASHHRAGADAIMILSEAKVNEYADTDTIINEYIMHLTHLIAPLKQSLSTTSSSSQHSHNDNDESNDDNTLILSGQKCLLIGDHFGSLNESERVVVERVKSELLTVHKRRDAEERRVAKLTGEHDGFVLLEDVVKPDKHTQSSQPTQTQQGETDTCIPPIVPPLPVRPTIARRRVPLQSEEKQVPEEKAMSDSLLNVHELTSSEPLPAMTHSTTSSLSSSSTSPSPSPSPTLSSSPLSSSSSSTSSLPIATIHHNHRYHPSPFQPYSLSSLSSGLHHHSAHMQSSAFQTSLRCMSPTASAAFSSIVYPTYPIQHHAHNAYTFASNNNLHHSQDSMTHNSIPDNITIPQHSSVVPNISSFSSAIMSMNTNSINASPMNASRTRVPSIDSDTVITDTQPAPTVSLDQHLTHTAVQTADIPTAPPMDVPNAPPIGVPNAPPLGVPEAPPFEGAPDAPPMAPPLSSSSSATSAAAPVAVATPEPLSLPRSKHRTPLRRVHWNKLQYEHVKDTVWEEINQRKTTKSTSASPSSLSSPSSSSSPTPEAEPDEDHNTINTIDRLRDELVRRIDIQEIEEKFSTTHNKNQVLSGQTDTNSKSLTHRQRRLRKTSSADNTNDDTTSSSSTDMISPSKKDSKPQIRVRHFPVVADQNRSQNIEIALSQLKMTIPQIHDVVMMNGWDNAQIAQSTFKELCHAFCDEQPLTTLPTTASHTQHHLLPAYVSFIQQHFLPMKADQLEILSNICPTADQQKATLNSTPSPTPPIPSSSLSSSSSSDDVMGIVEQFYRDISTIPDIKLRIDILNNIINIPIDLNIFNHSINIIILSLQQLLNSEAFKYILTLILLIGNTLNSGTNNANAFGFDLLLLTNLNATKSSDGKTNLMHWIVSKSQDVIINKNDENNNINNHHHHHHHADNSNNSVNNNNNIAKTMYNTIDISQEVITELNAIIPASKYDIKQLINNDYLNLKKKLKILQNFYLFKVKNNDPLKHLLKIFLESFLEPVMTKLSEKVLNLETLSERVRQYLRDKKDLNDSKSLDLYLETVSRFLQLFIQARQEVIFTQKEFAAEMKRKLNNAIVAKASENKK